MRFARIEKDGRVGLATLREKKLLTIYADEKSFPGSLETIVAGGAAHLKDVDALLSRGAALAEDSVTFLPPFTSGKIICVGLNYVDHSKESGYELPEYPTIFGRFASSLVGHKQPIVRPTVSTMLDYEGEMVAVIGKGGARFRKRARSITFAATRSSTTDRFAIIKGRRRNGRSGKISTKPADLGRIS
jgi:2-keto-4-pentenoate hydratase/2-oxohepta-3-ene-1,7-dioic acid hydratase in catechol pathway